MAKLSSVGADMDQNTPIMSPGRLLLVRPVWAVVVVIWAAGACAAERCTDCHRGAAAPHGGASLPCVSCHGGDAAAVTAGAAHTGMVVAPGELANAAQGCGGCHPGQLAGVVAGRMHTGAGMVAVTRTLLSGSDKKHVAGGVDRLDALGEGVADSLLRRLCAGCHLGQPRSGEPGDPVTARGGGCLACHLSKSSQGGHARVGLPVNDGACFWQAVTNIGFRPTFEQDTPKPIIEAHLLDLDRDLYDRELRLVFIERLRDERRFDGPEALREQIARDIVRARGVLAAEESDHG